MNREEILKLAESKIDLSGLKNPKIVNVPIILDIMEDGTIGTIRHVNLDGLFNKEFEEE